MKQIALGLILFLSVSILQAQDSLAPFFNDVQAFKKLDSARLPPQNAIVFTGSSSFTKWVDVQDYFPGHPIINRGFGGSSLPDVTRYVRDVVIRYKPKQVVIYCGENDIAASDTVSASTVFDRFRVLFEAIRDSLPGASIAYVSMKPSPSREKYWPVMVAGNALIKTYLANKPRTAFINVYDQMFNKDGTVMQDIFLDDKLHMNAKGYAIWQKIIAPYLL